MFGEAIEHGGEEFVEAFVLEGGNGEDFFSDAERIELGAGVDAVLVVGFVDDYKYGAVESAQVFGEIPVSGVDAINCVHDEEDDVGFSHGDFGLGSDLIHEGIVIAEEDSARINNSVLPVFPFGFGINTVSGDARRVFDHGKTVADESVEHCAFADVGSADNDKGGQAESHNSSGGGVKL